MKFTTILAAASAVHLFVSPLQAQELAQHLGPLAPNVELGVLDEWEMNVADGWFNMINKADPTSITYYFTEMEPVAAGQTRVVRVQTALRAEGGGFSAAGLLFNAGGDLTGGGEKFYFVLALAPGGKVMVLSRDRGGNFDSATSEAVTARLDGSDVLEIRETPGMAELSVNGERVFGISGEGGLSPNYGILATGAGRFGFTGFSISDENG